MRTQKLRLAEARAPEAPDATARQIAPESDAELALAASSGDLGAASRLYDRYASNVRGMVHRLLGPDAEIDDVVQDVFLTAIVSVGKLRDPAALKSWLLGIAVAKARGNLRTRWRRRWLSFLPTEDLPEQAEPSREAQTDIALEVSAILDTLRPEERIALLLCRLEGMSLEEAARVCGLTVSTFKRRLARGQARFVAGAKRRPALSERLARELRQT
jgi:RNA polymerase sigma-70 factor (ECF subfamily)